MHDGPCVYLLKANRYYVGSSSKLQNRMLAHKKGDYTTKRIGESKLLVGYIPCNSIQEARTLERKIKNSGHYMDAMVRRGILLINMPI